MFGFKRADYFEPTGEAKRLAKRRVIPLSAFILPPLH